ncbi:hypothetical protein ABPG74_013231 [Tetrahymena malaccensis]
MQKIISEKSLTIYNQIDQQGISTLTSNLENLSNLTSLDIQSRGTKLSLTILLQQLKKLKQLTNLAIDLQYSQTKDKGYSLQDLFQQSLTNLTSINIKFGQFDDYFLVHFGQTISKLLNLQNLTLFLRNQRIGKQTAHKLCSALVKCERLQYLFLDLEQLSSILIFFQYFLHLIQQYYFHFYQKSIC